MKRMWIALALTLPAVPLLTQDRKSAAQTSIDRQTTDVLDTKRAKALTGSLLLLGPRRSEAHEQPQAPPPEENAARAAEFAFQRSYPFGSIPPDARRKAWESRPRDWTPPTTQSEQLASRLMKKHSFASMGLAELSVEAVGGELVPRSERRGGRPGCSVRVLR